MDPKDQQEDNESEQGDTVSLSPLKQSSTRPKPIIKRAATDIPIIVKPPPKGVAFTRQPSESSEKDEKEIEGLIIQLKENADVLKEALVLNQSKIAGLYKDIDSQKRDLIKKDQLIDFLQTESRSLQEDCLNLMVELRKTNQSLKLAEENVISLKSEIKRLKETDFRQQVSQLEKQISQLQSEIKRYNPQPLSNATSPKPIDMRISLRVPQNEQPQTRVRTSSNYVLPTQNNHTPELARRHSPATSTLANYNYMPNRQQTIPANNIDSVQSIPSPKFGLQRGRITYMNGDVYEGEIQNNTRHGYGLLRDKDGFEIYSGYWMKDTLQGSGMLKNKKSNPQTIVDYQKIVVQDSNWLQFSGQLQNNKFHGVGNLIFSNKDRFQGSFLDGQPHGTGYRHQHYKSSFIRSNGENIRGHWQNGILIDKKL